MIIVAIVNIYNATLKRSKNVTLKIKHKLFKNLNIAFTDVYSTVKYLVSRIFFNYLKIIKISN